MYKKDIKSENFFFKSQTKICRNLTLIILSNYQNFLLYYFFLLFNLIYVIYDHYQTKWKFVKIKFGFNFKKLNIQASKE